MKAQAVNESHAAQFHDGLSGTSEPASAMASSPITAGNSGLPRKQWSYKKGSDVGSNSMWASTPDSSAAGVVDSTIGKRSTATAAAGTLTDATGADVAAPEVRNG